MDYRYPEIIVEHMKEQGLEGKYYHAILAGASLGAVLNTPPHLKPSWNTTFFDHLKIVLTLPVPITEVHILDHRNCKAYEIFERLGENPRRDDERLAHEREMYKLKDMIQERYEGLPIFLGLLEKPEGEEEFRVLKIE